MMEKSPSAGWRTVQQVMCRVRPRTGQEHAVLRRLRESGCHSIQSLRETVNTGEESLFRTISRLEDRGFVYAEGVDQIKITESGRTALGLVAFRTPEGER